MVGNGFMAVAVCAQPWLGISPAWSRNTGWADRDTEEICAEVYTEVLGHVGCGIPLTFSYFFHIFIVEVWDGEMCIPI